MFGRLGSRATESTQVNRETQYTIPLYQAAAIGVMGTLAIPLLWVAASFVFEKIKPGWFWPWFEEWWTIAVGVVVILWWVGVPGLFLAKKFLGEIIDPNLNSPVRKPISPLAGVITPFTFLFSFLSKRRRDDTQKAYEAEVGKWEDE